MDMTEDRAKRWLSEAEGYLQLSLLDLAAERVASVAEAGLFPYECAALSGSIFREREKFAEAIPHFESALKLRPGDLLATIGLGWCQKRVGRVDLAAQAYLEALKVRPSEAILHYNLACYQSLLGKPRDAVASLRRSFKIDKDYRQLLSAEADFDPIRADEEFKQLVAEAPVQEETEE